MDEGPDSKAEADSTAVEFRAVAAHRGRVVKSLSDLLVPVPHWKPQNTADLPWERARLLR